MLNKLNKNKLWRVRLLTVLTGALCMVAAMSVSKPAHALLVLGNYVFIGPKESAHTYKIKNISKKPEGYNIEWTQLIQQSKGPKKKLQPGEVFPGINDAEPYMYVAPRRLMLQAGQMQHVRFMVRRTQDMMPGEYRSYIYLNPEQIPSPYTGQEGTSGKNAAAASMTMLTGFRIPVIFLHGDTTLQTSVSNAHILPDNKGRPVLHFTFNRQGTRSAIGDVDIVCGSPQGETRISRVEIKLFTEVSSKDYAYPLTMPQGGCSHLAVDFLVHQGDPDYSGAPQRLTMLPLQ